MQKTFHQIRQCTNPSCQFRFPALSGQPGANRCPNCGAATEIVITTFPNLKPETQNQKPVGPEVEVLLDNIRSTFNVGSMFRTADGAQIRHVHLCGITPSPLHPKIAKTGLGAESSLPWTHHPNGLSAARAMKQRGFRLWALEGGERAEPLFNTALELRSAPILLVVGNEISGVDPGILELCEKILWIPMMGIKRSLNVAVAFGIATYYLRYASGTGSNGNKMFPQDRFSE